MSWNGVLLMVGCMELPSHWNGIESMLNLYTPLYSTEESCKPVRSVLAPHAMAPLSIALFPGHAVGEVAWDLFFAHGQEFIEMVRVSYRILSSFPSPPHMKP